jgi:hypothetical protein
MAAAGEAPRSRGVLRTLGTLSAAEEAISAFAFA